MKLYQEARRLKIESWKVDRFSCHGSDPLTRRLGSRAT